MEGNRRTIRDYPTLLLDAVVIVTPPHILHVAVGVRAKIRGKRRIKLT